MYLFTRTAKLVPHAGSLDWARAIGAAAGEAMGNPTALYGRAYSPGFGTVTWTSLWPDLATLESRSRELMSNAAYGKLLSEASTHTTGDVDDSLAMIVNGDPMATEAPAVVWTVGSVAANGHLAAAIGAGVEIAAFAEAATGRHPVFVVHQTGTFGGVSWVTGFESLAAYDTDVTKLFADPGWFPLIDRQAEHFSTDPSFLESALWVELS